MTLELQKIVEYALAKVERSLDYYPPYDIDEITSGYGIIVELSTYYFTISLRVAEIYNSETGEKDSAGSEELTAEVERLIEIRNREYSKDLEDTTQYPECFGTL